MTKSTTLYDSVKSESQSIQKMASTLTEARRPLVTASVETHTMGRSLYRYLEIKVHQAVRKRAYDKITVVGSYNRDCHSEPFHGEKTDKEFNWQRPTALVVNGNELLIQCFPGYDYVEHYAQLIATYLKLQQEQDGETLRLTHPSKVTFIPISVLGAQRALHATNLKQLPPTVDTVVLGVVHHFTRLLGDVKWRGGDECFGWTVRKFNDRLVAFVGCRPSFWGDLSGEVVHYLASFLPLKEVLYVGKLGTVKRGIRPNTYLATGERSYLHERLVEWENPLEKVATALAPDRVVVGDHVTVGSVMHETKDWLKSLPDSIYLVDNEIGTMAHAAVRSRIKFGYLHIISDNLSQKYQEDLSNERDESVLGRRIYLYGLIQDILESYLTVGAKIKPQPQPQPQPEGEWRIKLDGRQKHEEWALNEKEDWTLNKKHDWRTDTADKWHNMNGRKWQRSGHQAILCSED